MAVEFQSFPTCLATDQTVLVVAMKEGFSDQVRWMKHMIDAWFIILSSFIRFFGNISNVCCTFFWFELEALAPREVWTGWWPLGGHSDRKDRWDNFNLMQFISTYRANHWRNNSKNIPCFEEVVSEQFKSVDFVFGISQHGQVAVPCWWIGTRCRKISWYAWL